MVADNQLTPTLYIQDPILEKNEDPNILRKSGSLRGAKAVDDEAVVVEALPDEASVDEALVDEAVVDEAIEKS